MRGLSTGSTFGLGALRPNPDSTPTEPGFVVLGLPGELTPQLTQRATMSQPQQRVTRRGTNVSEDEAMAALRIEFVVMTAVLFLVFVMKLFSPPK